MGAETYKLRHPNGFDVEVRGAARRDVLLDRGYTETTAAEKTKASKTTGSTVKTSQGTKKQGNK